MVSRIPAASSRSIKRYTGSLDGTAPTPCPSPKRARDMAQTSRKQIVRTQEQFRVPRNLSSKGRNQRRLEGAPARRMEIIDNELIAGTTVRSHHALSQFHPTFRAEAAPALSRQQAKIKR